MPGESESRFTQTDDGIHLVHSGIVEPPSDCGVPHFSVPHLWGAFRFGHRPGRTTHAFDAAADEDVTLLGDNGLGCLVDGFQGRRAVAVYRDPRNLFWETGEQYKRDVSSLKHMTPLGILLRDQDSGRVKIRRDGTPTWHYRLSRRDIANMRTGVIKGAELLRAAGAIEVLTSSLRPVRWDPRGSRSLEEVADLMRATREWRQGQ